MAMERRASLGGNRIERPPISPGRSWRARRAGLLGVVLAAPSAGLMIAAPGLADPERAAVQAAAPAVESTRDPGASALAPATARFDLTPEQREKLRLAREAEARELLGLGPDDPLPSAADLTDAQRQTIRAARDAEMRRVLGLGPTDPIPDRRSATDEQRRRIAEAHEARIREALGLAPGDPLPRVSGASGPGSAESPAKASSAPPDGATPGASK